MEKGKSDGKRVAGQGPVSAPRKPRTGPVLYKEVSAGDDGDDVGDDLQNLQRLRERGKKEGPSSMMLGGAPMMQGGVSMFKRKKRKRPTDLPPRASATEDFNDDEDNTLLPPSDEDDEPPRPPAFRRPVKPGLPRKLPQEDVVLPDGEEEQQASITVPKRARTGARTALAKKSEVASLPVDQVPTSSQGAAPFGQPHGPSPVVGRKGKFDRQVDISGAGDDEDKESGEKLEKTEKFFLSKPPRSKPPRVQDTSVPKEQEMEREEVEVANALFDLANLFSKNVSSSSPSSSGVKAELEDEPGGEVEKPFGVKPELETDFKVQVKTNVKASPKLKMENKFSSSTPAQSEMHQQEVPKPPMAASYEGPIPVQQKRERKRQRPQTKPHPRSDERLKRQGSPSVSFVRQGSASSDDVPINDSQRDVKFEHPVSERVIVKLEGSAPPLASPEPVPPAPPMIPPLNTSVASAHASQLSGGLSRQGSLERAGSVRSGSGGKVIHGGGDGPERRLSPPGGRFSGSGGENSVGMNMGRISEPMPPVDAPSGEGCRPKLEIDLMADPATTFQSHKSDGCPAEHEHEEELEEQELERVCEREREQERVERELERERQREKDAATQREVAREREHADREREERAELVRDTVRERAEALPRVPTPAQRVKGPQKVADTRVPKREGGPSASPAGSPYHQTSAPPMGSPLASAPTGSVAPPLPMNMSGQWPGNLAPPMGYYNAATLAAWQQGPGGALPLPSAREDPSNGAPQPPNYFRPPQLRPPKRCALHVHIAHFVVAQQRQNALMQQYPFAAYAHKGGQYMNEGLFGGGGSGQGPGMTLPNQGLSFVGGPGGERAPPGLPGSVGGMGMSGQGISNGSGGGQNFRDRPGGAFMDPGLRKSIGQGQQGGPTSQPTPGGSTSAASQSSAPSLQAGLPFSYGSQSSASAAGGPGAGTGGGPSNGPPPSAPSHTSGTGSTVPAAAAAAAAAAANAVGQSAINGPPSGHAAASYHQMWQQGFFGFGPGGPMSFGPPFNAPPGPHLGAAHAQYLQGSPFYSPGLQPHLGGGGGLGQAAGIVGQNGGGSGSGQGSQGQGVPPSTQQKQQAGMGAAIRGFQSAGGQPPQPQASARAGEREGLGPLSESGSTAERNFLRSAAYGNMSGPSPVNGQGSQMGGPNQQQSTGMPVNPQDLSMMHPREMMGREVGRDMMAVLYNQVVVNSKQQQQQAAAMGGQGQSPSQQSHIQQEQQQRQLQNAGLQQMMSLKLDPAAAQALSMRTGPIGLTPVAREIAPQGHALLQGLADSPPLRNTSQGSPVGPMAPQRVPSPPQPMAGPLREQMSTSVSKPMQLKPPSGSGQRGTQGPHRPFPPGSEEGRGNEIHSSRGPDGPGGSGDHRKSVGKSRSPVGTGRCLDGDTAPPASGSSPGVPSCAPLPTRVGPSGISPASIGAIPPAPGPSMGRTGSGMASGSIPAPPQPVSQNQKQTLRASVMPVGAASSGGAPGLGAGGDNRDKPGGSKSQGGAKSGGNGAPLGVGKSGPASGSGNLGQGGGSSGGGGSMLLRQASGSNQAAGAAGATHASKGVAPPVRQGAGSGAPSGGSAGQDAGSYDKSGASSKQSGPASRTQGQIGSVPSGPRMSGGGTGPPSSSGQIPPLGQKGLPSMGGGKGGTKGAVPRSGGASGKKGGGGSVGGPQGSTLGGMRSSPQPMNKQQQQTGGAQSGTFQVSQHKGSQPPQHYQGPQFPSHMYQQQQQHQSSASPSQAPPTSSSLTLNSNGSASSAQNPLLPAAACNPSNPSATPLPAPAFPPARPAAGNAPASMPASDKTGGLNAGGTNRAPTMGKLMGGTSVPLQIPGPRGFGGGSGFMLPPQFGVAGQSPSGSLAGSPGSGTPITFGQPQLTPGGGPPITFAQPQLTSGGGSRKLSDNGKPDTGAVDHANGGRSFPVSTSGARQPSGPTGPTSANPAARPSSGPSSAAKSGPSHMKSAPAVPTGGASNPAPGFQEGRGGPPQPALPSGRGVTGNTSSTTSAGGSTVAHSLASRPPAPGNNGGAMTSSQKPSVEDQRQSQGGASTSSQSKGLKEDLRPNPNSMQRSSVGAGSLSASGSPPSTVATVPLVAGSGGGGGHLHTSVSGKTGSHDQPMQSSHPKQAVLGASLMASSTCGLPPAASSGGPVGSDVPSESST